MSNPQHLPSHTQAHPPSPRPPSSLERNIPTAVRAHRTPHQSLSHALYETLRDKIIAGEYQPGSRLPAERELAIMFSLNRGAVREAIQRLAQSGLIATARGGGSHVENYLETAGLDLLVNMVMTGDNQHRRNAVRSLIGMRTALAVDTARLAALHRTEAHATAILAMTKNLTSANDSPALQERLLALWGKIVDASGNIAYRLAFNSLRNAYHLFGKGIQTAIHTSFHGPDYRFLATAIASGDAIRAERGARRIVEKDAVALLAHIEAPNQQPRPAANT